MITNRTDREIQGRDINDDRWAAQALPAITEDGYPDLITIRTLDGNLHLDHADAAELALWLLNVTRPSTAKPRPSADHTPEAVENKPRSINCSDCGESLGMTTALEIVDGLCRACWEKAW